mgnify:CR=1 FL=1
MSQKKSTDSRVGTHKKRSKTEQMLEKFGVSHVNHLHDTYSKLLKKHPMLIQEIMCFLMYDLLRLDGYADVEVSYTSGIGLDVIRKLLAKRINHIDRESFLLLIGLYGRMFC